MPPKEYEKQLKELEALLYEDGPPKEKLGVGARTKHPNRLEKEKIKRVKKNYR